MLSIYPMNFSECFFFIQCFSQLVQLKINPIRRLQFAEHVSQKNKELKVLNTLTYFVEVLSGFNMSAGAVNEQVSFLPVWN